MVSGKSDPEFVGPFLLSVDLHQTVGFLGLQMNALFDGFQLLGNFRMIGTDFFRVGSRRTGRQRRSRAGSVGEAGIFGFMRGS